MRKTAPNLVFSFMKNLRLKPNVYRQQSVIKAIFDYDRELLDLIKTRGRSVRSMFKDFVFHKKDFQLNRFYQSFNRKTFVDYSLLKKNLWRIFIKTKKFTIQHVLLNKIKSITEIKTPRMYIYNSCV